ncbi:MAG: hypothetical protein KOO66_02345 [Bacteroidales bacterium]|nr:hypothetical protein [Bacteroidales bacterium]
MALFYNITDWNEKPWFSSGGTRDKQIVEDNEGQVYYFKTSIKKDVMDYKFEFWSEIIASKIGKLLGFDTLNYEIAVRGEKIGCLSKAMNLDGESKLIEGISFLTGYDNSYDPEKKDSHSIYSYQFICDSLNFFDQGRFISDIDKIIILDSIIGNGDRHQENWGVISNYKEAANILQKQADKDNRLLLKILIKVLSKVMKDKDFWKNRFSEKLSLIIPGSFAPVYDNGSCLGREITDQKLEQMLKDDNMFNSYIKKGKSEIHWNGGKLNHFELIKNISILKTDKIKQYITDVKQKYSEQNIENIVKNIDLNLPKEYSDNRLPDNRKRLIIKLINLRVNKLFELVR